MRKFLIPLFLLVLYLTFPYSAEAVQELRISYVKAPFNLHLMVMRQNRFLENAMKQLGVKVTWSDIILGAHQVQALGADRLDVSGAMNSASVLIANAEGNKIRIIASIARPMQVFGIVAPKNGVKNIKELNKKIVAGPKGTVLHQILVSALKKNNMSINDINFVQMPIPRALGAMKGGSVNAALLAGNTLLAALNEGDTLLADAKGHAVPKLFMTATEKFLLRHSRDWLPLIVTAYKQSLDFIKEHHDEAVSIGAKELNLSLPDAEKLLKWYHFTEVITTADLKSLEEEMDFLLENGLMRTKVDISTLFSPDCFKGVEIEK